MDDAFEVATPVPEAQRRGFPSFSLRRRGAENEASNTPAVEEIISPKRPIAHREAPPAPPHSADRLASESGTVPSIIYSPRGYSYKLGKKLGKGGFATCFQAKEISTSQIVAAKVVAKASLTKETYKEKLASEIYIHKQLDHPRVVGFIEHFEDDDNVYMILALCSNGTMGEMLRCRKRLSVPEVQFYGRQLVEGLQYLHSDCLVLHRDLKLGNLMLDADMNIKIGDFGLAAALGSPDEKRVTVCGTPNYIPPEVLHGKHGGGHSYEADVWSFSIVLYTLLVGRPPFETDSAKSTYKRIQEEEVLFPTHLDTLSDDFKELIWGCTHKDPAQRLKLHEILAHPFFNSPKPPRSIPTSALTAPPKFDLHDLDILVAGTPPPPLGRPTSRAMPSSAPAALRRTAANNNNQLGGRYLARLPEEEDVSSSANNNRTEGEHQEEENTPEPTRVANRGQQSSPGSHSKPPAPARRGSSPSVTNLLRAFKLS